MVAMAGKQAKILNHEQVDDLLTFASQGRFPIRNRLIVLLSVKAGLRAGEIANLTWEMVTDPVGEISTTLALHDHAAKKKSGRVIPLHPALREAMNDLRELTGSVGPLIRSQRGGPMTGVSIVHSLPAAYRPVSLQG